MDIKTEIKNGKFDLLTHGLFLLKSTEATNLKLSVGNESITLIIKFENNPDKADIASRKPNVIDNTTLEITFTNYNNNVGNYSKEFWKIGSITGRNLYWIYAIYGFGKEIKKVEYTFYLGEEVENG